MMKLLTFRTNVLPEWIQWSGHVSEDLLWVVGRRWVIERRRRTCLSNVINLWNSHCSVCQELGPHTGHLLVYYCGTLLRNFLDECEWMVDCLVNWLFIIQISLRSLRTLWSCGPVPTHSRVWRRRISTAALDRFTAPNRSSSSHTIRSLWVPFFPFKYVKFHFHTLSSSVWQGYRNW